MELNPREDLRPLQSTHLLHPVHQVPTAVVVAVRRFAPGGDLGTSYVEVKQGDDGSLTYDVYWLTDRVFGHLRGHSLDHRWPTLPLNQQGDYTITCDIRSSGAIEQVSAKDPFVAHDDFSQAFTIETGVTVALVDGTSLDIGFAEIHNDGLRKRRDAFIDALIDSVGPRT